MYTSHRHKPTTIDNNKRALWPLHFEKKRKNNKWPIPHKISCDGKLTYFRQTNEWKFAWIYETEKKLHETQVDGSIHAVSIDPGVRTPFTWYSPTKGVGKIGEPDIGKIVRLCMHMDDLSSKKDKLASSTSERKKKKALRVDKAIFRMQRKIKHLRNEIHRKTIKFLTDEFDVVIIPPFEVSNMVNRKTRKITRKTVRKMLCWSHYNFRQRLISKAEEKGIHVIIQNEAYTSKTCSCCGKIQKIGGSEVFNCQNCRTVMDRDENGARGIFLRALLDGALILSGDHAGNN
jgi:putative transposase